MMLRVESRHAWRSAQPQAGFAHAGEVLQVLHDLLDAEKTVLGFGQELEDVLVEKVEILLLLDSTRAAALRSEGAGRLLVVGLDDAEQAVEVALQRVTLERTKPMGLLISWATPAASWPRRPSFRTGGAGSGLPRACG
jgi:hypothetical protein